MSDFERIKRVIQYLEKNYREQPSLETLARISGLSPFHFHRLFSRWAGITPKTFLKFLTATHAKSLLKQSRDLLGTSLDSGLSGSGRLHDLFVTLEGVTQGQYKSGGTGLTIYYGFHPSKLGDVCVGLTERGVCYLSFTNTATELKKKWPKANLVADQKKTAPVIQSLFTPKKRKKLSTFVSGTPFQIKVWEALLTIPKGHVLSYSDIATKIGNPKASRAVGTAIAQNEIAVLIPCHRVIRETGVIGEYRWGRERKIALLAYENTSKSLTGV